jgi:hypothetical protein
VLAVLQFLRKFKTELSKSQISNFESQISNHHTWNLPVSAALSTSFAEPVR